jgi:hypothetical protein
MHWCKIKQYRFDFLHYYQGPQLKCNKIMVYLFIVKYLKEQFSNNPIISVPWKQVVLFEELNKIWTSYFSYFRFYFFYVKKCFILKHAEYCKSLDWNIGNKLIRPIIILSYKGKKKSEQTEKAMCFFDYGITTSNTKTNEQKVTFLQHSKKF